MNHTPEHDPQLKFLRDQPPEFVACRQRHQIPRLAFTRSGRLPKGIRAVGPYPGGVYDIKVTCESCQLELSMWTGSGGDLLALAKPRRKYPHGYLAKGMGRIAPSLARSVGYEDIREILMLTATPPPSEEDEEQ